MPKGSNFNPTPDLSSAIRDLYLYGFTMASISRFVGVSRKAIWYHLQQIGVTSRPSGMVGRRHRDDVKRRVADANRKHGGSAFEGSDGYILCHVPLHPFADSNGNVREHRLIMERYLGRYLTPREVVHHINGNRADNRIENLQLFATQEDHQKYHDGKA